MEPKNYKRAIIVGIFVFLGAAIFIAAVLTLGGQHKTFVKTLTVEAVFDDVNGLQKGGNVWFSGVKVGTISKVVLAGNNNVLVGLAIEKGARQFIHKDAKAKIGSDGLIGNKIVVIYGGTPNSPVIDPADTLGTDKMLSTEDMLRTLQKNNDNLLSITTGLKTVSENLVQGKGSIGKLLSDETLASNLISTSNTFKKAAGNINKLSSDLAAYTSKLNSKGSMANEFVTDTIIFNRLKASAAQFHKVSLTSQEIVNNLQEASKTVNASLKDNTTPVGVLLQDRQAAATLKTTLNTMQSASVKLDQDLEAVQHNFLLRGFFRKKAKKEKADSLNRLKVQ